MTQYEEIPFNDWLGSDKIEWPPNQPYLTRAEAKLLCSIAGVHKGRRKFREDLNSIVSIYKFDKAVYLHMSETKKLYGQIQEIITNTKDLEEAIDNCQELVPLLRGIAELTAAKNTAPQDAISLLGAIRQLRKWCELILRLGLVGRERVFPGGSQSQQVELKFLGTLLQYWKICLGNGTENYINESVDPPKPAPLTQFVFECFNIAGVKDSHKDAISLSATKKRIDRALKTMTANERKGRGFHLYQIDQAPLLDGEASKNSGIHAGRSRRRRAKRTK